MIDRPVLRQARYTRLLRLASAGIAICLAFPTAAFAENCDKLVTPENRFQNLPDYEFATKNADLAWGLCKARMHYVDLGPRDGTPILLLHGQPSWSFMYRRIIQQLAKQGFRVVAPDLIGYGRSDKFTNAEAYSYARHRESIAAFIKTLDLKDTILVVHDWGGLIGLPLVAQEPDRFAKLVLLNTSLNDGTDPESTSFKAGFDRWIEHLRTVPLVNADKVIAAQSSTQLSPDVLAAYMAPYPDGRYQSGLRQMSALIPRKPSDPGAAENTAARATLSNWTKPVLIAFSEDSERLHPGQFDRFGSLFSKSADLRQIRVAGSKHFLVEDKPDEIARQIISFAQGDHPVATDKVQAQNTAGSLSGAELYKSVEQYTGFGEQRTGSAASATALDWIEKRLTSLGYRTRRMPVPFTFHDVRSTLAEIPGKQIADGFPLWPPQSTGTEGVSGTLRPLGDAGIDDIALVRFPFSPIASIYDPAYQPIVEHIARARPRGVIAITEHPSGEVVALNVRQVGDPRLAMPFLLVGQKYAASLTTAATALAQARIAIDELSTDGFDANLVADSGPANEKAIVISTPKNGWFGVGGERGPGIAIALGLAEWLKVHRPTVPVRLVFTSHHELGGQGMKAALDDPAFAPAKIRVWLHLGANIAVRDARPEGGIANRSDSPSPYRSVTASDVMIAKLRAAFAGAPDVPIKPASKGRSIGEAVLIARAGIEPVVGISGYQLLHHTRLDDISSVAPGHLEALAAALSRFLGSLE